MSVMIILGNIFSFSLTIVPLHSSISNTEQQKVFLEADQGMRKVTKLLCQVQDVDC